MYIDIWIKLYILKKFIEKISGFYYVQLYSAYLISYELHKIILFGKLNIAVIIITMLGILSKKMAHIWNV
jgi:uncharacterized membrane protein